MTCYSIPDSSPNYTIRLASVDYSNKHFLVVLQMALCHDPDVDSNLRRVARLLLTTLIFRFDATARLFMLARELILSRMKFGPRRFPTHDATLSTVSKRAVSQHALSASNLLCRLWLGVAFTNRHSFLTGVAHSSVGGRMWLCSDYRTSGL